MRTYNKANNSIYYNPDKEKHFDFTLYARNNKETIYEKQRLSYANDEEKRNKRSEQMRLYQMNRRSKNNSNDIK